MASTILANYWISNLSNQTDPITVNNGFMKGLGDYITNNVKFEISFSGVTPSGAPITGIDVMNLNGLPTSEFIPVFNIPAKDSEGYYTDGLPEWINWMTQIYSGIDLSIITNGLICVASPPITAFTLTSPTWNRDELKSVHENNLDDPQGAVLDKLATCIMNDMKKFYLLSFPALYGVAEGMALVNSIILP